MLHRRTITTKRDAFDYFDAIHRAGEIASAAHSREMKAWRDQASREERLAAFDLGPDDTDAGSDPAVHVRVAAALAKIDGRRDRRRESYVRARFVMPGEVSRLPVLSRPRGTVNRPRARRTHAMSRSSSRAGDSGADDPPDEPPLARLRAFLRSLTRLGRS